MWHLCTAPSNTHPTTRCIRLFSKFPSASKRLPSSTSARRSLNGSTNQIWHDGGHSRWEETSSPSEQTRWSEPLSAGATSSSCHHDRRLPRPDKQALLPFASQEWLLRFAFQSLHHTLTIPQWIKISQVTRTSPLPKKPKNIFVLQELFAARCSHLYLPSPRKPH